MSTLSGIEVPPGPGPWKPIETRMRTYVNDPADALVFAGRSLTHTDWMPDNVLISRGRAWLVDWAWATPAQSWIDQGFWLIRLIANGHTVAQAEAIAAQFPAYAAADPAHVAVFARANVDHVERDRAGPPGPLDTDDGGERPHMGRPPHQARRLRVGGLFASADHSFISQIATRQWQHVTISGYSEFCATTRAA